VDKRSLFAYAPMAPPMARSDDEEDSGDDSDSDLEVSLASCCSLRHRFFQISPQGKKKGCGSLEKDNKKEDLDAERWRGGGAIVVYVLHVCECLLLWGEGLTWHPSDSFPEKGADHAIWRADNVEVWLQRQDCTLGNAW
jgi:hypothetical protein